MTSPVDLLRETRRNFLATSQDVAAALQEGAVTIRELKDRIRYLEQENERLRSAHEQAKDENP